MRTLSAVPTTQSCVQTNTSELGTPLYTEQTAGLQWCPLYIERFQCRRHATRDISIQTHTYMSMTDTYIGWQTCKYNIQTCSCVGAYHAVAGCRGSTVSSLLWLLSLPPQVWSPGSTLNGLSIAGTLVQQPQNTLVLLKWASHWVAHSELGKGGRCDWDEQRMQWR